MKSSFTDRQTVLINSTRALKFLESYGDKQTKLWKVLFKYHRLPDHFHNLQTNLQAEFVFLEKATSKNIENLQETVKFQQTYTTALCSHVNVIHTKLAQLEKQFQTHCIYPHPQIDSVQIKVLEYDLNIDGHICHATRV